MEACSFQGCCIGLHCMQLHTGNWLHSVAAKSTGWLTRVALVLTKRLMMPIGSHAMKNTQHTE